MKKNVKLNKTILKAVEKAARQEVEKNAFCSSPQCTGIFHQPKRPK